VNRHALAAFRAQVMRLWTHALRRRSQHSRWTRTRRSRLARLWLPVPHIDHPFPWQRLHVTTEDRSPVRETRTLGSVRGVSGNRHPYRDSRNTLPLRSREEEEAFALEIYIDCDGTL
jgi:hypothetical protein